MADDDFEVIEPDTWRSDKNVVWSHQELVMRAMKEVLKIGCHDLTPNVSVKQTKGKGEDIIIKEDTRKSFINAVRICKAIMRRDFDKEAEENIDELMEEVEKRQKELLNEQWIWWVSLSPKQKSEKNFRVEKNFFNKTLSYYADFIEFQVEASWEIFEELNNLTGRLKDYEVEEITG